MTPKLEASTTLRPNDNDNDDKGVATIEAHHHQQHENGGVGGKNKNDMIVNDNDKQQCTLQGSEKDMFCHDDESSERRQEEEARSIDDFLEEAYASSPAAATKWRYWLILWSVSLVPATEAMTILNVNFLFSDATFQEEVLHDNYGQVGAMVSSALFAGMLVGGIVAGVGADVVGRRPILVGGSVVNALFSSLAVLVGHSPWGLGACRFFCGLGIGANTSASGAHVAEASPPSRRGLHSTVTGSFWTVGSLYTAVIAIAIFSSSSSSSSSSLGSSAWWAPWRSYLLAMALPCVASALCMWSLIPESSRYLATQGRYEEATRAANQLALAMGYLNQDNWLQVSEVMERHGGGSCGSTGFNQAGLAMEKTNNHDSAVPRSPPALFSSIATLFGRELRGRTVPSQVTYFSLAFGTALTGWITTILKSIPGTVGQNAYWISCFVVVANVPGSIVAALIMDRVSRRSMLSTSMWASALALAILAIVTRREEEVFALNGNDDPTTTNNSNAFYYAAVVLSACAFHSFISISWFTMVLWATELLPTTVRTTGLGVMAGFGRVAGVLSQFLSGLLMDAHRPGLLLGLAAVSVALGGMGPLVLKSSMVETSGTPLTDVVVVVLGDNDNDNDDSDDAPQAPSQAGLRPLARGKIRRRSGGRYAAAPQSSSGNETGAASLEMTRTTTRLEHSEFVEPRGDMV